MTVRHYGGADPSRDQREGRNYQALRCRLLRERRVWELPVPSGLGVDFDDIMADGVPLLPGDPRFAQPGVVSHLRFGCTDSLFTAVMVEFPGPEQLAEFCAAQRERASQGG